MLADGLGQGTEGLQPAAHRPTTPPLELTLGGELIGASVNGLQRLAQSHRPPQLVYWAQRISSLFLACGTEVPNVATQAPE